MTWYNVSSNWVTQDGNEFNFNEILKADSKLDAMKNHVTYVALHHGMSTNEVRLISINDQHEFKGIERNITRTTEFVM